LAFFSETNVKIQFSQKLRSSTLNIKRQIFCQCFRQNVSKIITSVPGKNANKKPASFSPEKVSSTARLDPFQPTTVVWLQGRPVYIALVLTPPPFGAWC
jgi:hypothetical protein